MLTTTSAATSGLNFRTLTALISGTRRQYYYHSYRRWHPRMSDNVEELRKGQKKRGHPKDSPDVRISKTLAYLLRHGGAKAGVSLRQDGYARVTDVLAHPMFRDVTFAQIQQIVKLDTKSRYHLMLEPQTEESASADLWWIRANQGHSIKDVNPADLKPILSASDIPMAVHGTTRGAWQRIATQGLSRMTRNHIHLAQGVVGSGVISGMRQSSQILIFIDVQKALDAGIKFYLSENGVVLTEGNSTGFLPVEFFERVENADRTLVDGWRCSGTVTPLVAESQTGSAVAVQDVAETPSH